MYFREKKWDIERSSCVCGILHPLLNNHDVPQISSSFSKNVPSQGLSCTSGTGGDVGSRYPGGLEGTEASKGDVVQVTKPEDL